MWHFTISSEVLVLELCEVGGTNFDGGVVVGVGVVGVVVVVGKCFFFVLIIFMINNTFLWFLWKGLKMILTGFPINKKLWRVYISMFVMWHTNFCIVGSLFSEHTCKKQNKTNKTSKLFRALFFIVLLFDNIILKVN